MAEPGSGQDRQGPGDAGPVLEGDLLGGFSGAQSVGDAGPGDLAAECAKVRASEGCDAPGGLLEMRPIRMAMVSALGGHSCTRTQTTSSQASRRVSMPGLPPATARPSSGSESSFQLP